MEEQKLNPQQLQDLIEKMPPKTQEAYYAVSTAESIYEARQVNGIPDRLAGKIAAEIANIMLGLLNPADLTHKLINFGIPEAAAANFYRLISQSTFLKIKDELDQIYKPEPRQTRPESRLTRPEPAGTEKTILSPILPPLPGPIQHSQQQEPHLAQSEPPQREESIVRIKVEPPPLRHVAVHNFEEKEEGKEIVPQSSQQQSQPRISDPYREPVNEETSL